MSTLVKGLEFDMTSVLKELELDEVSLVDVPANPHAKVPLFKRDKGMEENQEIDKGVCITIEVETPEEEMQEMQMQAKNPDVDFDKSDKTEQPDELVKFKAENERLRKALIENGFVIKQDSIEPKAKAEEVEKKEELIDFGGEMVAKSAIPAPVLKKLEEIEKAQELADLRKRAEDSLPNFKGTVDQKAQLIKAVDGISDTEMAAAIMEALKAADNMFASAFEELGKSDAETESMAPAEKLNILAKNYQTENKVTFEKAYAEVVNTAEGKDLLKQTYN
jgi:hypothetical protein